MSRAPGDVYVKVDPIALRYIQGKKAKIDFRGPVFTASRQSLSSYRYQMHY